MLFEQVKLPARLRRRRASLVHATNCFRDGVAILFYELLALGYALPRERYLLAGYREAWQLRHGARRRRLVQARRRVSRPPFGLGPPA